MGSAQKLPKKLSMRSTTRAKSSASSKVRLYRPLRAAPSSPPLPATVKSIRFSIAARNQALPGTALSDLVTILSENSATLPFGQTTVIGDATVSLRKNHPRDG